MEKATKDVPAALTVNAVYHNDRLVSGKPATEAASPAETVAALSAQLKANHAKLKDTIEGAGAGLVTLNKALTAKDVAKKIAVAKAALDPAAADWAHFDKAAKLRVVADIVPRKGSKLPESWLTFTKYKAGMTAEDVRNAGVAVDEFEWDLETELIALE